MAGPDKIIADIFSPFQDHINAEQDVREVIRNIIKEIEKSTRDIITNLQVIHSQSNCEYIHHGIMKSREIMQGIAKGFEELDKAVPPGEYYRYNDHWRFSIQRLCFLAGLIVFLEKGILIERTTASEMIGVSNKQNIHLDLEDYLMGLLNLASELSRFAVSSVILGDFSRPLQISKFVGELNAGFRLLNLKNDSLRKRFDALKYDVRKTEEVVYDLSIRGLIPGSLQSEETNIDTSQPGETKPTE
ncbi:unnamed protein product [Ceutorhynchus assimilis]|uniref:Translin n=1 Tax=Ceutorhynchus assimilis TaxID=467358 RepID=A0A9N9QIQ9_9CUCU|nr:unnamed protein product [Ceutorhynchus assimilis]